MNEPVLVSGRGVISPFGDDLGELTDLTLAGAAAGQYARMLPFPLGLDADVSAGVAVLRAPDPNPKDIPNLRRPFPDRLTLLAIQAADAALRDAELDPRLVDGDRAGVLVNSSYGPSTTVESYLRVLFSEGPGKASAIGFARSVANAVLGELTRRYGFRGAGSMTVSGSLLGYAYDLIRDGAVDALLCVGVDILGDNTPWYYRQAGLLDGGLILGEASAALVLERRSHAEKRDARAVMELVDYAAGFCPEAVQRVTDFSADAVAAVLEALLERSGCDRSEVDLVSSLDNGHRALAKAEQEVLSRCGLAHVNLLRTKRTVGECFGASELLGAAVTTEAIARDAKHRQALVGAAQIGGSLSFAAFRRAAA